MATPATIEDTRLPIIALVGRVNVGKSTLFNRLIEEQKAIVSDIPGTTRTNNEGVMIWRGNAIGLVDTGGLTFDESVPLEKDIIEQSKRATAEADVILFITDAHTGILPQERELAKLIRKTAKKPVILVANKVDNTRYENEMSIQEFKTLGFGAPFPVSASSGRNLGDLLDLIYKKLHSAKRRPKNYDAGNRGIRISIIGKPNVGKSSLFNKLLGEDRVIVNPMPHTTREPHDTTMSYVYEEQNKKVEQMITFVDTAGIRRKANVSGELERIGIQKSIQSIEESDIILLVLDGSEPISSQDKQLAGLLEKRAKSVIIVINKWDLATDTSDSYRNKVKEMIYAYFPHINFAPIVFVSGKTGHRTHTIFPLILAIWRARHTEIPAPALEAFIRDATHDHKPARGKGTRHPEIKGLRQLGVNPPVFEMFIKYRTSIHPSYVNYIERRLREQFDYLGTPIIIKLTKMKR